MKIEKNSLVKPLCLLLVTVIFSVLTYFVDRAAIGLEGTSVGFSSLNGAVSGALGYNGFFDKVSDLVMVLSFLVVASFAFIGLLVLVKTKSIAKVGKTILGLGILYLVVAIIYVAFDKIPINYRPLLQPGETEIETSFPSSHTLVICSVFGSAMIAWKRLLKNKTYAKVLRIAAVALMVIGVCARLLAGVHWLTDIIAGVLFSLTLVSFYAACSKD
ncbi:phosphatase PAP2 family protein [Butyrivibrio sp. XPD2006]|uniref:phosphatase PAP2 family protein n=1 Tax=Butyrivibrio sp. XPD2006 TaxID=1280668 RepID=UPI0003B3560B|nr:phosphatase PAP2 family protein [Butyrivibrio sp. XPD2006]